MPFLAEGVLSPAGGAILNRGVKKRQYAPYWNAFLLVLENIIFGANWSVTHYELNNGPQLLSGNIRRNFVMCERSFSP